MSYQTVLILLLSTFMTFDPASAYSKASAVMTRTGQSQSVGHEAGLDLHDEILDKVDMLLLQRISNGQLQNVILTGEDLKRTKSLDIDGYISGIVAFCKEDMAIYAADQKMDKVRRNPDGTLFLQYYGNIKPDELRSASIDDTYCNAAGHPAQSEMEQCRARAASCSYSLFPRIRGDSVSSDDQFLLRFERGEKSLQIPIRQTGFCILGNSCVNAEHPEGITFRYIGNRLKQVTQQSPNLESKIHALAKGSGSVEKAFHTQLINEVNILDYEGIQNAMMSEEKDGIWIYIETLREESSTELETIAEHEALHKFVHANELARDSAVRQLFADLKGYAPLAPERFLLMMGSDAIPESSTQESSPSLFFAFINEKNFLAGRKGGHSQENVAEFCTSFLHSLMFLDRLEHNLDQPVKLSEDAAQAHPLSVLEKKTLLDNYVRTLKVFMRSISRKGREVPSLLVESLARVQELQERDTPPAI